MLQKRPLITLFVTKIILLYTTKKEKEKNLTEQEKALNSAFESVEKYPNELNPNKAGLFEGSFFWGGGGGQFDTPPPPPVIFQEDLI